MLHLRYLIICLISTFYTTHVVCQDDELYKQLVCMKFEDCTSCLNTAEFCHWCADLDFNKNINVPSCNVKDSLSDAGCPIKYIMAPEKSYLTINDDMPLRDVMDGDPESAHQMRPQKISLQLRPGEIQSIEFEYRPAKNYPLDLYYLMDLTWSMRDDKETLVSLRNDLPKALKDLTKHFRLGFGSFAEKPLMPYSYIDEKHKLNPCSAEHGICEPTYTFRHRLKLTSIVEDFVHSVNDSNITGNLDNDEAGLEGLMQVLVCDKEIGWIPTSRKIVILASDGSLHFAGNGKLGGVVKPNDERCHLVEDGSYTASTELDYPTLAQINKVLIKKKVNVIFAVTEDVSRDYNSINELIPDYTYVGQLAEDSSNVINLVKRGFEDFVSVINFGDDSEKPMQLTYYSDCGKNGIFTETNKCENVKIGETYKFKVNITMDKCPKDGHRQVKSIAISEAQFINKPLLLNIELHCNCDCGNSDKNIDFQCPVNARLECGQCVCLDGWSGPECDCQENFESTIAEVNNCFSEGERVLCSRNGDCICGACICDPGFSGVYCECRRCETNRENGLECSGQSHGACNCGTCVCREGWSGFDCSCSDSTIHCAPPGSNEICSGKGECVCENCQCSRENGLTYTGKYCETCANCNNTMCALYEEHARSVLNNQVPQNVSSISSGILYLPQLMNELSPTDENANICIFRTFTDYSECEYKFTYDVNKDWSVNIKVYSNNYCVPKYQTAIFGTGLFIFTIIIGFLIIIAVKLYQYLSDKKAYDKFMAEHKRNQMEMMKTEEQNPIYKSPITTFKMPDEYDRNNKDD